MVTPARSVAQIVTDIYGLEHFLRSIENMDRATLIQKLSELGGVVVPTSSDAQLRVALTNIVNGQIQTFQSQLKTAETTTSVSGDTMLQHEALNNLLNKQPHVFLDLIPRLPRLLVKMAVGSYYGARLGKLREQEFMILEKVLENKIDILPEILGYYPPEQLASFIGNKRMKYLDQIISNYPQGSEFCHLLAVAAINSALPEERVPILKEVISKVKLDENNHEILRLAVGSRDASIMKVVMDAYQEKDRLVKKLMNLRITSPGNDTLADLITKQFEDYAVDSLAEEAVAGLFDKLESLAKFLAIQLLKEIKTKFRQLNYSYSAVRCLTTLTEFYNFKIEDPVYRVLQAMEQLTVKDIHSDLTHSDRLDDDLIYATGDLKRASGLVASANYWTQVVDRFLPDRAETLSSAMNRVRNITDPTLRKAFINYYSAPGVEQRVRDFCNIIADMYPRDTDMALRHILTYAAIYKNLNFVVARTRFMKGEVSPAELAREPLDTCTFPEMRLIKNSGKIGEYVISFADAVRLIYNVVSENIENVKDLEQVPTLVTVDLPMSSRMTDRCRNKKLSDLVLMPYPDGNIYCFEREELKDLLKNKQNNPYTGQPFPAMYTQEIPCSGQPAVIDRAGLGKKQWQTLFENENVCRLETGGGGDCLFFSLGAALVDLYDTYHDLGVDVIGSVVQELRTTGDYLRTYFASQLRYYLQPKLIELGGPDYYNNADLWLTAFSEEEAAQIAAGGSEEAAWETALEIYLNAEGLRHFGTDFEVYMFEKIFNVGVIIFDDSKEDGFFYNRQAGGPFKYYVTINYLQKEGTGLHFQLAGIYNKSVRRVTSGFSVRDLPQWLIDRYQTECNVRL